MYTKEPNIGNLRETFFLNQLDNYYKNKQSLNDEGIFASKLGDFYCEDRYTFEVGGKNKGFGQIKDIKNSFVASDDIEVGFKKKILFKSELFFHLLNSLFIFHSFSFSCILIIAFNFTFCSTIIPEYS